MLEPLRCNALTTVITLDLYEFRDLTSLVGWQLPQLRVLCIDSCGSLTSLRGVPSGLTHLRCYNCATLTLEGVAAAGLSRLLRVELQFCESITSFEAVSGAGLSALYQLNLSRCPKLTSLRGLERCGASSLHKLCLAYSPVTSLQPLALCGLTSLSELDLSGCTRLTSLEGLASLPALAKLAVCACTQFRLSRAVFGEHMAVKVDPNGWLD